jgi:hypothetical protein
MRHGCLAEVYVPCTGWIPFVCVTVGRTMAQVTPWMAICRRRNCFPGKGGGDRLGRGAKHRSHFEGVPWNTG